MKKYLLKVSVVVAVLAFDLALAQSLGLQSAGQKLMNEVAGAFPYVAGILFVIAGWKALNEYSETKDHMAALKIVMWYILAVLVIVGGYQFVKGLAL